MSLAEKVSCVAESVYVEYGQTAQALGVHIPGPIHEQPLCAELSSLLRKRLEEQGIPADLKLHTWTRDAHYFLQIPGEEPYDADMTWQQFLARGKRSPNLPRALVLPHADITRKLGELGMSRRRYPIWTEAENCSHGWRQLENPVLETVLGIDPYKAITDRRSLIKPGYWMA